MLLSVLYSMAPAPAAGQQPDPWDPTEGQVSRERLTALLDRMERAAESPAYSDVLRSEARDDAERIRTRLDEGDFRPGDRVYVRVEQYPQLTDTFTVAGDRSIVLQGVGAVSLGGLLRSELDDRIMTRVSEVIRSPRILTRSLVRLQFTGSVARPGFHVVDSQALLSDALMAAGGPTADAKIDRIEVERGREVLLEAEAIREALSEGRTIDQLGLRDGDRLRVPSGRQNLLSSLRDVTYVMPMLLGLLGFLL